MAFKTLPGDVLSFKLTHMFISHMVAEKSIFEDLTFFGLWVIFSCILLYFCMKSAYLSLKCYF